MPPPSTKIEPSSLRADALSVQKRSQQALHSSNTASVKYREKSKLAKILSLLNDSLSGTNRYLQFGKTSYGN